MKCSKCGNELRLESEEYCKDVQGRPMYRNFAYCDNCKEKTPLGYNRPYNGHSVQSQTTFSQPPQKLQNFFRYTEIIIGILSLLGCVVGIDSTSRGDNITGMFMIIFFGLVSFLFFRKSNRDKFLDYKNKYMNTLMYNIQLKEHELRHETDSKENELNNIRSKLDSFNKEIETINTELNSKNVELEDKTEQLNRLNENIDSKDIELNDKNRELNSVTAQIAEYQSELSELEDTVISKETAATIDSLDYTSYDSYTSEECKNKLTLIRQEEKELIKDNDAVHISSHNSKKQNFDNSKQILRCFNAECDNIILSVNIRNVDSLRNRIIKSFDTLNKIFNVDGVSLSNKFLELKLKELTLLHTFERKRENEREIQRAIKEQMLEEERVRRELEKRKGEIEKDQKQFSNEVNKLMKYLQKRLYVDKIKELEEKIKTLESEKADVVNREKNAKAGFVYIISNIGSFGENVYKIGMTRRLEPMDRIKELSSASVPFEFDVHAMIFSEDAPALESSLHQHFDSCRVNKINPRKEFFNISIDEIEQYVTENYNDIIEFTKVPIAKEYRDTQALYEHGTID